VKSITADEYLHESLVLLVRLCGVAAVKAALKDIEAPVTTEGPKTQTVPDRRPAGHATVPRAVAVLEETDKPKHALLKSFFERIDSGTVLPAADDIRLFVELLGIKHMSGRARRDLIPKLAQSLVELPLAKLEELLPKADDISAAKRRNGYSVLTDKLLENVKAAS